MWSTRASREAFRPRHFSMGISRPWLSTWSTGLTESMVPNSAAAALTRPPRFRWFKSSTVNQWQMFPLAPSAKSKTSSRVFPFFFS